ncbi:MAG TPA: hypothetical protein VE175_15545, partial [Woeseiaceae bacterium]|nr:hypothetical protein [Woeseiaceae bacterium]
MSDNDLLALLSAAADGQLGPDERAEMERRLRDHPDAQRFQADLHRMERLLRCVPEELPPEALHRRIIAGLLPSLPARRSVRDWLQHFIPVPVLQYGLAAAAGLLLAVAFYELQPTAQDPPDIDQMVGTIAPARDESDILDSYHLRIRDIDTLVQ